MSRSPKQITKLTVLKMTGFDEGSLDDVISAAYFAKRLGNSK
jgi:hypothetical protein